MDAVPFLELPEQAYLATAHETDADEGRWWLRDVGVLAGLGPLIAISLFFWREGYQVAAVSIAGLPLILAFLIWPRMALYAYCSWQAWDSSVVFGSAGRGGWLTVGKLMAFVVLGVCLLQAWRHPLRLLASRGVVGWAVLLMSICLLSSLWSYDQMESLRLAGQILVQILLLIIMVAMIGSDRAHLRRLALWTIIGGGTAAAYIFLFGQSQEAFRRATLSEQANPNSAAAALVVAMVCVPLLWCLTSRFWLRLLLIGAFVLMLIAVVKTGSRAAIGGLLGGFTVTMVLAGGRGRFKRIVFIGMALAAIYGIGAAVVYSGLTSEQAATRLATFMHLPPPNVTSRFVGQDEGIRQHVWTLALQGYFRTGLMGAGIGCSYRASGAATGIYRDVHSNLLGALVELGPIGLIAYVGLGFALLLRILMLRDKRLQVSAWLMLLSTFAIGLVHTTYTAKCFWLPVTFLVVIYELDARLSAEVPEPEPV